MAWIYHNAELWVISMSSDWENWLTIADKNLGATQVYNDGDTLSEANSGKYYQWWNNYWFPFTWSVTTSSTQVNAQNYWPWNYYNSSTFIIWNDDWSSVHNDNLWWDTTNTNEARQWPSSTWFHIPSITEWQWLKTIMNWLGLTSWNNWRINLHIPFAGLRSYSNADLSNQGSRGYYWSSSPYGSDYPDIACNLYLYSSNAYADRNNRRTYGLSIRTFANESITPDYTWTRIYWDEIPAPKYIKRFQNNWNYYYFWDAPVHASGVTLNKSSLTLTEAGQTEQLIATVTPSDAVEKSVTWTSSDITVAKVYQDWTVECVNPGECTITCTVNDGGYTATCDVDNIKEAYVEYIVVWWWWWWGSMIQSWYDCVWWWGWWWWDVCAWCITLVWSTSITIWAWWASWCNWWDTTFWNIIAKWWCAWKTNYSASSNCKSWWDSWKWCVWWNLSNSVQYASSWWWGWWADWVWWSWTATSYSNWWCWQWWNWWLWKCWYWWWGWGWMPVATTCTTSYGWKWCCWWWDWWTYNNNNSNWCPATKYWWWWWWGWCYNSQGVWWAWCKWVVFVCYLISCWYDVTWWCKYTCWDYTIHCFTSDWTLTVN